MDYTKLSDQELLELLACTGRGSNSEFKIRTEISRRDNEMAAREEWRSQQDDTPCIEWNGWNHPGEY